MHLPEGLPTDIKRKRKCSNVCEVQEPMRSVLAPRAHIRASVFNIFDVHFSNASLESHLFTISFYL